MDVPPVIQANKVAKRKQVYFPCTNRHKGFICSGCTTFLFHHANRHHQQQQQLD